MTSVINVASVVPLLEQLGWRNVNLSEALEEMRQNLIAAPDVLAYLKALAAAPDALDDSQIAGCDPAVAAKITAWLKQKNLVA